MNNAIFDGQKIGTGEALLAKEAMDGVIATALICYNQSPPGLELTLSWTGDLPGQKIDFVMVAPNEGYSFLAAFRYTNFGLEMTYSENSNPMMVNALAKSKTALIKEVSNDGNREYQCELKHCFD